MPKASIQTTKEVTSAELPEYLRQGWRILSWGTWSAAAFVCVIGKGA